MFKIDGVRRRARKSFGKISKIIETPNLIAMQKRSYERYLQKNVPFQDREDVGLQAAYMGVFPIHDFAGTSSLEFVKYAFEGAKYSEEDCLSKGMTYEASLRLTVRLVVFDTDTVSETKSIRDIKEQEIYFGTLPIMTDRGTFIINGTERAVVSQLHRSPGAFFDHDKGKTHASGKLLYSARIIPLRGSWLDFEFDPKDFLYVRIDRRRKFPVTILLKALGYTAKDLLYYFYDTEMVEIGETGGWREARPETLAQDRVTKNIVGENDEVLAKKGIKFTKRLLRALGTNETAKPRMPMVKRIPFDITKGSEFLVMEDISDPETGDILIPEGAVLSKDGYALLVEKGISRVKCIDRKRLRIPVELEDIVDRVICDDLVDPETGEVLLEGNSPITLERIDLIREKGVTNIECLLLDGHGISRSIRETLLADRINTPDEAILDIYRKMRPSSPPTSEVAETFFRNLFFNLDTYDLSRVGRLKLNYRLNMEDIPLEQRTLRKEDIFATVEELIRLKSSEAVVDDIDNLGNRRVRAVGELLENQYRVGLVRMERAIKERMSLQEVETLMPHDLINSKPVSAVVKEFFGTSQLSQFMDQTNPLSEVTHKRRLSALGPGGLTRERAGFEVRDVHPTHYGRICPIETPEGPNIGLIVSLSTYAQVNEFGFIETPYRRVSENRATESFEYLSALDEKDYPIAQAKCAVGR